MAHGIAEAASHVAEKKLAKIGLNGGPNVAVGDQELTDERTTFTRDGKQVPGFASSVVPTMEEKIVTLNNPTEHSDSKPKETVDGRDEGTTVDGQKFGAPADASATDKIDDQPPHARSGIDDADGEERAAPDARNLLRKTMGSKHGHKGEWTLPTPRPVVDAQKFSDPICDSFWRDTWMASAVHNVSCLRMLYLSTA